MKVETTQEAPGILCSKLHGYRRLQGSSKNILKRGGAGFLKIKAYLWF